MNEFSRSRKPRRPRYQSGVHAHIPITAEHLCRFPDARVADLILLHRWMRKLRLLLELYMPEHRIAEN